MAKTARRAPRRDAELRALLEARRRQLTGDVSGLIRDVRSRSVDDREVADAQDGSEGNIQDDLSLAVIQMKAETLGRIDAALRRLEAGHYGACVECASRISVERLRALPFAVRCTPCEDARERGARDGPSNLPRRAYSNPPLDV